MKFLFLLISGSFLLIGYINQMSIVALCGSILYILIEVTNLFAIVRYERLSREGKYSPGNFKSLIALMNQLSTFLEIIIFFFAAITSLFFPIWFPKGLWVSSLIISLGQFVIWILSGLIGRSIKHVPIKMGFGGWYILREVQYNYKKG